MKLFLKHGLNIKRGILCVYHAKQSLPPEEEWEWYAVTTLTTSSESLSRNSYL